MCLIIKHKVLDLIMLPPDKQNKVKKMPQGYTSPPKLTLEQFLLQGSSETFSEQHEGDF